MTIDKLLLSHQRQTLERHIKLCAMWNIDDSGRSGIRTQNHDATGIVWGEPSHAGDLSPFRLKIQVLKMLQRNQDLNCASVEVFIGSKVSSHVPMSCLAL